MPLSWNEIKDRALRFSREWADEASEDAEAQSFWNGFFDVFGVSRRRVANFEKKVRKVDGKDGYIDLLWKGVLLVEHKSRGRDLDRAHAQARDYFHGLADAELPKYLLVSDFARFRLYDLDGDEPPVEFALKDLHRHVRAFGFIAGYQARSFKDEDPVNIEAAERMGRLHDALKAAGYAGHELEVLLVRLLFCLFAEDTGIFPRNAFHELISQRTGVDGADLGQWLAQMFQTLDTAPEKRQKTLDAQLAEFPYVNGKLFAEPLRLASFDAAMRAQLLHASTLDWSRISPAIFGSMFQSVMDAKARRNLGAHYTSEKNILKLIGPLFLDDLKAELQRIGSDANKLKSFHVKLSNLRFLDPACGCGNFLVIAYRELRALELEVLRRQFAQQQSVLTRVAEHVAVDVDQFYGIEIEEFPAQIAQVALWLMDHQMNLRVAEQFGEYFARLPLTKSPTIVHGNALRIDWNEVVPRESLNYILGNPPFGGHHYQSAEQKNDQALVMHEIAAHGVLDFVANWHVKTSEYIQGSTILCAFVSTNSITQGEQVGLLWPLLLSRGVHIQFAHRTFKWSNEARSNAAVHCVIIGFGLGNIDRKLIFDYPHPNAEPTIIKASNINPYLVDAPDVILTNRTDPICAVPRMSWGNKPTDGGHLILSSEERSALLATEPTAARFVRRYMGGGDFINDIERYCLWLTEATPDELRGLPMVMERVEAVRQFRLASTASSTRDYASYPTLFRQIAQPTSNYLAVPEVSSEQRHYIPIAFVDADVICSNTVQFVPDAKLYQFGVLESAMHMAWMRTVCGRLESRYRYSNSIVYNNFPWPELPSSGPSGHLLPKGEGKLPSPTGRGVGGEGKKLPPKEAIEFARTLRQQSTDAEKVLWLLLRDRRLGGFKFRRQHPLPPYTLDFYCEAAKLCVELDGGQHGEDRRDVRRDAWLTEQGIRTLRVWNNDVFNDLDGVLTAIWDALQERPSPPTPLPEGEGSNKHRAAIEAAAQGVLDARAQFPDATLADLYDPLSMPPALVKAHQALDRAVDAAYIAAEKSAGRKPPKLSSDAERVAFLFERYQALTSLLPAARAKKARKPKRTTIPTQHC